MNHYAWCSLLTVLTATATAVPDDWRRLPLITDGKIDAAWAHVGWGGFVVDDGSLRTECDQRGMGLLFYKPEKFGDCQVRVVYRCEKPTSNAGVFVRIDDGILARIGAKSPEVRRDTKGKLSPQMLDKVKQASEEHLGGWYPVHHGYEVQILDAADPWHRTGAIYSLSKAARVPKKSQSEWRTMIITLEGERISVDVDGTRLSSFDAGAADPPPRKHWSEPIREGKRPTRGYLGLQNHDPGDVVWFKEVSVRPCTRAKYEPADGTTYHGVCLPGYWKADEFAANLAEYRNAVGEGPPLVLHSWFAHCQEQGKWRTWHWMNQTPDGGRCAGPAQSYAEVSRKHGLVPVIAWTWMEFPDRGRSPRLQDLVAGKYDWYLDDWIKGLKEFRDPVFIRLSHEMDGDWYPYSEGYKKDPLRNTARDYVAYWRYVVDRFRKADVTNVAWVWCVNGDRSGGKDWPDYYPGDEYLDWLAIDVYSSRNPREVIGQFLDLYGKKGKPIMIPEGGTGPEQTRWNKRYAGDAAWVKELFDVIEATPQLKALCWFQWGKEWNIQRDPGQLAEYQRRIRAARYSVPFHDGRDGTRVGGG